MYECKDSAWKFHLYEDKGSIILGERHFGREGYMNHRMRLMWGLEVGPIGTSGKVGMGMEGIDILYTDEKRGEDMVFVSEKRLSTCFSVPILYYLENPSSE